MTRLMRWAKYPGDQMFTVGGSTVSMSYPFTAAQADPSLGEWRQALVVAEYGDWEYCAANGVSIRSPVPACSGVGQHPPISWWRRVRIAPDAQPH